MADIDAPPGRIPVEGGGGTSDTIYTADGTVSDVRIVSIPNAQDLIFRAFQGTDFDTTFDSSLVQITAGGSAFAFESYNGAGLLLGSRLFTVSSGGIFVIDDIGNKGIEYLADYSAGFTANSLVSKAYTDIPRSTQTVYVSTEADIDAAFGDVVPWVLSDVNLVVLENITLTDDKRFSIGSGVTIYGVDRNASSLSYRTEGTTPFLDFAAAFQSLRINNINFSHKEITATGPLITQNGSGSVMIFTNCGLTGNVAGGGDCVLLAGQLFQQADGVMQAGASIVVGDGVTADAGMDNIVLNQTNLLISGQNNQRCIEFTALSHCDRITCDTFAVFVDASFVGPFTGSTGFYFHESCSIDIFDYMNGGIRSIDTTSTFITVEDASVVTAATIEGNTVEGSGQIYQCIPQASSVESATDVPTGCDIDADGNLMIGLPDNSVDIYTSGVLSAPTNIPLLTTMTELGDITFYRGLIAALDLSDFVVKWYDLLGVEQGTFDAGIITTTPSGISNDGTLFYTLDDDGTIVSVSDPFSLEAGVQTVETVTVTGLTSAKGITNSGANFIVPDTVAGVVRVLERKVISGALATVYSVPKFSTGDAFGGVDVPGVGYVEADADNANFTVTNASLILTHASPTWMVINNAGLVSSGDRGGSVVSFPLDFVAEVIMAIGNWVDLTNTDEIFFGSKAISEKFRMTDQLNGEVTYIGTRSQVYDISGQVIAYTNTNSDITYEVIVAINDVRQYDAITTLTTTLASDNTPANTPKLTAELDPGDTIKIQVRRTVGNVIFNLRRAALSIS